MTETMRSPVGWTGAARVVAGGACRDDAPTHRAGAGKGLRGNDRRRHHCRKNRNAPALHRAGRSGTTWAGAGYDRVARTGRRKPCLRRHPPACPTDHASTGLRPDGNSRKFEPSGYSTLLLSPARRKTSRRKLRDGRCLEKTVPTLCFSRLKYRPRSRHADSWRGLQRSGCQQWVQLRPVLAP